MSSGANFDVIKQQKYLARTLLSLETQPSKPGSVRSARRSQKLPWRGLFLGFGGVRVSDAEAATLRDISKALGMAS